MEPVSHPLLTHIGFLLYLIRHKWYVFRACRLFGVPLRQALLHDWSKFTPAEWLPYTRHFRYLPFHWLVMGNVGTVYRRGDDPAFDQAGERHWRQNPHHWQHWCRRGEDGTLQPLPIPDSYAREMVADWIGASKAQGNRDIVGWYAANRAQIILHPQTRRLVEHLLDVAQEQGLIEAPVLQEQH